MQEFLQESFEGYGMVDLLTADLVHSVREVDTKGVKELIESFKQRGIDRVGFPVVILVEPDSYAVMGKKALSKRATGTAPRVILKGTHDAYSGGHRQEAIRQLTLELRTNWDAKEDRWKKSKAAQAELEAIAQNGLWLCKFYRKGAHQNYV